MKFAHSLVMHAAFFCIYATLPIFIFATQPNQTGATQSANKVQPIHTAAYEGRISNLRYLIEHQHIDPNIKDDANLTPLHYAAANNQPAAIEYLIQHGANIRARDENGSMPIHFAALLGHVHALKFFIEKCFIDKEIQGAKDRSPLHCAALKGHLHIVKYLIKQKASVNAADANGAMPIHLAAAEGHTHVLKHFITKSSVDKNICGDHNRTPLHYAAQNGHLHTVKYLVRQKADINARDSDGRMPIHLAALNGHTSILKYFIEENHTDKNINSFEQYTPLHYASLNGHLAAVKYLIKQNANTKARSSNGSMPIHFAVINGHMHILKYFIEDCNIDKDIRGCDDQTPLHYAVRNGDLPAVEYLIKLGCNTQAQDALGRMPVHIAATEGHTLILKHLIEGGYANENTPGPENRTPLHYAALNGRPAAVEYLIKQGANLKAQTKTGQTALTYAWGNQHTKIIHAMTGLLLKYNEHNMLIPVPRPSEFKKMTEWKELMCIQYAGQLPECIEAIAQETAEFLNETNVLFYHTSDKQSHATDLGFSKIGLSTSVILAGLAYTINKSLFKRCMQNPQHDSNEKRFKRTLYHELCHIKAHDTTKYYKEKILGTETAALVREMAAELGAMYCLYTMDKTAILPHYIADDEHPSPEEQSRYNAQLYARLLDNPSADFAIVEELAELYHQEKISGTPMVKDIILPIAKKLFEKKMLNKNEYAAVVYACSGRIPSAQ